MKVLDNNLIKSTVASIFLLRSDGAALFQHRDDKSSIKHPNKWGLPGGQIEIGESLEEGVLRELYEETGYKSDSAYFIRSYLDNSAKGWPEYSCAFFWCFYDELQKINCYEGQSMKFIPRNHANVYDILEFNLSAWDLALKFSKMKKFKV